MSDIELVRQYPVLRQFRYGHLPPELQDISRPIRQIAFDQANRGGDAQETAAGLRKLLEAKDCFVRAGLRTMPINEEV